MGVAVRTRRHSYRARLRIDLSCVAKAQIFRDSDPNVYLSGISDIFRFRRERQVAIAHTVPRAHHHRSFECRDHTRMRVAEVFRRSGKALEFGDGHEIAKMSEFHCPAQLCQESMAAQGTQYWADSKPRGKSSRRYMSTNIIKKLAGTVALLTGGCVSRAKFPFTIRITAKIETLDHRLGTVRFRRGT